MATRTGSIARGWLATTWLVTTWLGAASIAIGCSSAPDVRRPPIVPRNHPENAAPSEASRGAEALPIERAPLVFPKITSAELSRGLRVVGAERATDALVELRVVIGSGTADDGEHPGRAAAAARFVAEAAGRAGVAGDIDVDARVDHTVLRASVVASSVEPTLTAIGEAMGSVKVGPADAKRIAKQMGASEAAWLASLDGVGERLARRALFVEPTSRHPFSIVHPTSDDLAKLDAASMNECAKKSYVASNLTVIAVGPVGALDLGAIVERAFTRVAASRAPSLSVDEPMARPRARTILLVDDPRRARSSITVGRLGPALAENEAIATRLFGQVVATRLVARAARARASFRLVEYQDGPGLALLEGELDASHAADVVSAMFDPALGADVTPKDLVAARGAELDALAVALDRPGFVADSIAERVGQGRSAGGLERDLLEADTTGAELVSAAGRKLLAGDEVVVAVGDASKLGPMLAPFGEVDVLDPARDLERIRTLPRESERKLPLGAKARDD